MTEWNSDILTVNGLLYYGSSGRDLNGVIPLGEITWVTDSSVTYKGWKICQHLYQPPSSPWSFVPIMPPALGLPQPSRPPRPPVPPILPPPPASPPLPPATPPVDQLFVRCVHQVSHDEIPVEVEAAELCQQHAQQQGYEFFALMTRDGGRPIWCISTNLTDSHFVTVPEERCARAPCAVSTAGGSDLNYCGSLSDHVGDHLFALYESQWRSVPPLPPAPLTPPCSPPSSPSPPSPPDSPPPPSNQLIAIDDPGQLAALDPAWHDISFPYSVKQRAFLFNGQAHMQVEIPAFQSSAQWSVAVSLLTTSSHGSRRGSWLTGVGLASWALGNSDLYGLSMADGVLMFGWASSEPTTYTNGSQILTVDSNIRINDGEWYEVVASKDMYGSLKLFINGQLQGMNWCASCRVSSTKPPRTSVGHAATMTIGDMCFQVENMTLSNFDYRDKHRDERHYCTTSPYGVYDGLLRHFRVIDSLVTVDSPPPHPRSELPPLPPRRGSPSSVFIPAPLPSPSEKPSNPNHLDIVRSCSFLNQKPHKDPSH